MVSEVIHIRWYATILRGDLFAEAVAEAAPVALRYGARRYAVHRSQDDAYAILQMIWFERHGDWLRYWEGPEMIEFRARYLGKYQVPITYVAHRELVHGEAMPIAEGDREPEPVPTPAPSVA
jgi:hypothetical protein